MVGALKNEPGSGVAAADIPSGDSIHAAASTTANGPSSEASVARPPSDVLRQVQVVFGSAADLWCIGHSVASL
jgi:hypothetical protein